MKKLNTLVKLLAMLSFTLLICGVSATVLSVAFGHVEYAPIITTVAFIGLSVSNFKMPVGYAFSSPVVFTQGICKNIQTSLNALMGPNAPQNKRTPVGYLQAITSPTNTAGLSVIPIDSKNGKKHKVDIRYAQRGTEDDIQFTYNNGCTPDISKQPYEETVEITDVISLKGLTFSEDEMRKLCEPDQTWIAEQINAHLDPFMRALNKKLITKQFANFGNFADGTNTVKSRQLLNVIAANNKVPNIFGENQIFNDFEDIDFNGRPIIIGAGKLRDYVRLSDIGCCNNSGVDNSQGGDFDYFNDRFVGGIAGNADDFIALAPGNVQLLTYNKYKGAYVKNNNGNFAKTTIIDPFTGLELDMRWKYNDCDETWILTFSLWYNMFFLPTNAFADADPLDGVNYSLHYRATEA
jgi:hypothetical protein